MVKKERSGFISRSRKLYNVNIKILVCQIIGPAASGFAGPFPMPVALMSDDILQLHIFLLICYHSRQLPF